MLPEYNGFWPKVDKRGPDECWEWQAATTPKGYGCLRVNGRLRGAHRVAWEIANGPIPDGLHVLHRCDVRVCVNPDHLFLGTPADNTRDMVMKGRTASPLTSDAVNDIRIRYEVGAVTQQQLANEFGVTQAAISQLIHHKRHTHIDRKDS